MTLSFSDLIDYTMIDCLFEQWLERHDQTSYTSQLLSSAFAGHGPQI